MGPSKFDAKCWKAKKTRNDKLEAEMNQKLDLGSYLDKNPCKTILDQNISPVALL